MSNCRDTQIQIACFTPFDGSASVSINHTVVFDSDGKPYAIYFSDRAGVVIDETSYLGGGTASLGQCPKRCDVVREVYRLDGTATGASTVILPDGSGAVGNTVTIPAGFKSLSTTIMRQTQSDDGSGTISSVEIDGAAYFMGSDSCGYATDLPDFTTSCCGETFIEPVTITAVGAAFIEIWVTKET